MNVTHIEIGILIQNQKPFIAPGQFPLPFTFIMIVSHLKYCSDVFLLALQRTVVVVDLSWLMMMALTAKSSSGLKDTLTSPQWEIVLDRNVSVSFSPSFCRFCVSGTISLSFFVSAEKFQMFLRLYVSGNGEAIELLVY